MRNKVHITTQKWGFVAAIFIWGSKACFVKMFLSIRIDIFAAWNNYARLMHNYSRVSSSLSTPASTYPSTSGLSRDPAELPVVEQLADKTTNTTAQQTTVNCSVIGARGYSGLELSRLLLQHPTFSLRSCYATSAFELSQYIDDQEIQFQQNHQGHAVQCLAFAQNKSAAESLGELSDSTSVVFLATPAETSLELAPHLLSQGKTVIDLSGAFRLKKHDYKKWYSMNHNQSDLLQSAKYGLMPWNQASKNLSANQKHSLSGNPAQLIANPGCYATAILMALLPLIKNNLIQLETIVIDAKSGTSGAGRKAAENLLFTEVADDVLPYKVGRHQHWPEIVEAVFALTGEMISPMMTTHLLPVRRGITSAIYARVQPNVTSEKIYQAYAEAYQNYELLKWNDLNNTSLKKSSSSLLSLRKVVGTANTHISFDLVGDQLYVFSLIDNLLKGAASQAVENLNALTGQPLDFGLQIKGIL